MVFGEVGGLNDFIALVLATFFGFFSQRFLLVSLVQQLYRSRTSSKNISEVLFRPLLFSKRFVVANACMLGECPRDRKALLLKDGMNRVEDSLDVVKLVQSNRALNTLLRLLLTKEARHIIRL